MRKIIVLVIAAMMVTLNANAQSDEQKNEIGVYYGFASASSYVSILSGAFSSVFTSSEQGSLWGPIGVEYYRHISPVVAIGGVVSIAGCKWGDDDFFKSTYITVMPSVKFNWLRKNNLGLYSAASAGIMFINDKVDKGYNGTKNVKSDNVTTFMFQGTLLGAEVGGKFRGFAELGFGEKGVVCAGLRYRF
jgi:hypothetical protein